MANIEGKLKSNLEELSEGQPGDFCFLENDTALAFNCPDGCGDSCCIYLHTDTREHAHPKWQWDGNKEKPTLSPSILRRGDCAWHGFLVNGVWQSCG